MTDKNELPGLPFSPYLISEWTGPEMTARNTWTAYTADQMREYALQALVTRAPAAVAEGWVLVPREPTPEMLDASEAFDFNTTTRGHNRFIYLAMLRHAPAAPAPAESKPAEDMYDTMYSAQHFLFLDPNGEGDESNTVPLTLGATFTENGETKAYYHSDRVLMGKPAEPVVPNNCRERLRLEGSPYPRSGCYACGKWFPKSDDCIAALRVIAAVQHAEPVVDEAMVERAMHARIPGGSEAWVWLFNCEGGMAPQDKHRNWFRRVLKAALRGGAM